MASIDEIQTGDISAYDYSLKTASLSNLRLVSIPENNGSPAVSLNSVTSATYNLPAGVYNLAQSVLNLTFNVPALASNFNKVWVCAPPFQRVQLRAQGGSSGGAVLYDNSSTNYYCEMARMFCDVDDWIARPSHNSAATQATCLTGAMGNPRQLAPVPSATATQNVSADIPSGAAAVGTIGEVLAPQNFAVGSAANTVLSVNAQIKLSQLGGIFALDKSLPYPQLYLEVQFLPTSAWGLTNTTAINDYTTNAALASNVTDLTRVLYLASEQNDAVISALREKGELRQICNYIEVATPYSLATGSGSITVSLSESAGAVVGAMVGFYHPDSVLERYRRVGVLSAIGSRLNSQLLHDNENYNEDDQSWYREMRNSLKDTPYERSAIFDPYPVWVDNFIGGSVKDWDKYSSALGGLSLPRNQASQYTLKFTVSEANATAYVFVITKKMLTFNSSGGVSIQAAYVEDA